MSGSEPGVDPRNQQEVAAVVASVAHTMGSGGVIDLLSRLPGVRLQEGSAKRFLTPAVPACVWIGAENRLTLTDPLQHAQVVGGIVLHSESLTPAEVAPVVARLISSLTREQGSYDEVGAILSAAKGAAESF